MKLLIYSHFFAPSVGGVETIVLSLARGLARLPAAKGEPEFEIALATETPAGQFDDSSLPFRVIRQPSLIKLWDLIRDRDVVHVAGPALIPILLGLIGRKRVVVEHHGFQTICPNGQLLIEPRGTPCPGHFMAGRHGECLRCNSSQGWFASLKLWLLTFARRFLSKRVSANITPTVWLGELVQLPGIVAIPHGLELVAAPAAYVSGTTETPVVAFQGRLVTTKGVGILFDAARILFAQNQVFELLVIGDGPERIRLEQISKEPPLAGRVRFAGRLSGERLDAELARVSVVVVPSVGGEVFGLVVAENMMRGLPVITSDLGAFVEVLGDGGSTFPTGDAAGLAREIRRLIEDPKLRAELRQRARQRVLELCDFDRMVEDHARLYRQSPS